MAVSCGYVVVPSSLSQHQPAVNRDAISQYDQPSRRSVTARPESSCSPAVVYSGGNVADGPSWLPEHVGGGEAQDQPAEIA
ncbi:hypothetical protein O7623_12570 [Solwaraspora sp. WMMD791]|uniref:hypothetical protein n=1 Tax=Solwaraspora sp. WMMD791 TaxID=3016086 RepID=UPI002499E039|nr:hypothetical protein [Solwaraspora sp. WMMD791]WFE29960.1 hypothetical protein O7623_12570 [Solwaraspora sp. WMMD791]